MKKKAAFVDHSFHKITSSSLFIKELLSTEFELIEYFDESWNGGTEVDIDYLTSYEYVFYWQVINEAKKLKKLKESKTKIVWFPMWDSVVGMKNSDWLKYQTIPIKVVCFSKILYEKLHKFGFDCEYFQYFIDPQSVKPVTNYEQKQVYFWNRTDAINWDVIRKLLGNNSIDLISLMAVPDPKQNPQIPPENDLKKYNIQLYTHFLDRDKYIDIVSESNIYIAPRKFEGIGMSFIEALCRGQCVIAPNFSTMNEYITDGVNGFLYNFENLEQININNFDLVGKEARHRAIEGYKHWKQQKVKVLEYISDFNNVKRKNRIDLFININYFKMRELLFSLVAKVNRVRLGNIPKY